MPPDAFSIDALPPIPRPGRVLLTSPDHFRVEYVINPHMAGNVGDVDPERARRQWESLKETYERLGMDVEVLAGAPDLPDMVFCANQSLPYQTPGGELGVILSRMHAEQRKPEVEHYDRFFGSVGYEVQHLDLDLPGDFEGMGDAIWHPGRYLLWGGYGYRTDKQIYERFAEKLGFPVVAIELTDPDFYHLDTCLCPIDEETALYYPGAFTDEGIAAIKRHFRRTLEAPEDDARERFACNAHSPDGKHVLIQAGSATTNGLLRAGGYEPVELDTSEFLKSGGSVFCMKLMYW